MNSAGEQGAPRAGRLLFLCQTLPFPPDSGVAIRSYNILRQLARQYSITLLCFYRRTPATSPQWLEAQVKVLRETCAEVEVFPILEEYSRPRLLWNHARSLLTQRSFVHYSYESPAFSAALGRQLRGQPFDLIHVDSLDLVGYLPALMGQRIACTHHNVESRLLLRRADAEASSWRGPYFRIQAGLVLSDEKRWVPDCVLNLAVSQPDADTLRELVPGASVEVVPNGVDTQYYSAQPAPANGGLVFVGGTSWFPNRDGLGYFAAEILPLIRRRWPDLKVTWVGQATDAERKQYAEAGIVMTGYVDDIRPYVHQATCFIVPLRVGGGTRLKILDAWAMGMAVVSTSIGCEGLATEDGGNILVRDTPAQFADAIDTLLRDPRKVAQLGRAARQTAERLYSWPVIGKTITDLYQALPRDDSRGAKLPPGVLT